MKRLWVDLTTSYQDLGRPAHGTLRVERGIVSALSERQDPRIGFVVFDRANGRFQTLSAHDAALIAAAPARPERGRELASAWRRRAWGMEGRLRWLLSRTTRAKSLDPPGCEPFATGDTLLLPGEHNRQDAARLVELKQTRHLALAFVFYDLLRVLEDDDPRLLNRSPASLPQTDFMVREAALLLPISRFSADVLQKHLARRGASSRPVEPIRLAGHMPAAATAARPVPGLPPGRFVLSVGDVVHRKNHKLLVEVWASLTAKGAPVPVLVIAGRIDLEGNALVRSVRRDPRLRAAIRFMPNVNDATLLWLYRNCRHTAFPSLREGFGLPVAESLSQGKVCLASSTTAIPEAGQGVALTLDPSDAAAWETEVVRLSHDRALAAEEARVARLFRPVTWSDTADDIVAALAKHGYWPAQE